MTTEIGIILSAKDQSKAAFASLNRNVEQAGAGVSKLQGLFAGAFAGISIAGTMAKFITETRSAEQEQAQLAAVVRSTGEAAGWSVERLNEMATALSRTSTYSEGDINNAQTRLLAYTDIVGKAVPETMQAVLNMSARTTQSLEQSAETLGKAINTPSAGMASLKRLGFDFGEEQIKLAKKLESTGRLYEAQRIVLDEMERSYGGAAKAARDTFGGAISALQNNIDNLLTGDTGSMKSMKDSVEELNRTLESEQTRQAFQTMVGWMTQATNALVGGATAAQQFIEKFGKIKELGAVDLVVKDAARAMLPWGNPRMTGDHVGDLRRLQAERAELVAKSEKSSGLKAFQGTAAAANEKRAKEIAEIDRYIELLTFKSTQSPKFADPRVLGDPGSIASQAAALRGAGGGGGSGGGGSKTKKEKDLEAEAKRAIESLEKQVEKTRELSEVEKQLEEIRRIRDGGGVVTEAQKQRMLQLAAEVDAGKERDERLKREEKEREAAQERENKRWEDGQRLIEQTRTPLEAYTAEVARLNALLKDGSVDQETHARALGQAWRQYDDGQKALQKLNTEVDDFSKRAAGNIQDQLGDGLYNALTGNFESIGKAWGDMLLRMVAQAAAAKLSRSMFGDLVEGGKGSGWAGAALKAVGGWLGLAGGKAPTGAIWGSTVSAGLGDAGAVVNFPKFDVGTNYVPQDMLAMVHKGEKIVPARYNRAVDPDAQRGGGASMTFSPVINIDSRSDRAAINADVQRTMGQAFREYTDQLKRGGVIPS